MEFLKKVENKVRGLVGGALMLVGGFSFVTGICVLPANAVDPIAEAIMTVAKTNIPEEPVTEESSEEEETEE